MDIIKYSLKRPVSVIAFTILTIIFGFLSFKNLPYQLTPFVNEPEISIVTVWPGATPYEVERDIIDEQESVLKKTPGLIEYESSADDNMGTVTLKFKLGTNIQKAMLDVSNKLNEIDSYPENVLKPIIKTSGESASPIIWLSIQKLDETNNTPIDEYLTWFENEVKEKLERIDGVADLFIAGGTQKELHIEFDPIKLASYKLTIEEIINIVKRNNSDIAAGSMDLDRRTYRIRTISQLKTLQDFENLIIKSDGRRNVYLKDVSTVKFGFEKRRRVAMFLNKPGIIVGVKPDADANAVDLTNRVEAVVKDLNKNIFEPKGIFIRWLYDQRPYIVGSIDLLKQNILIGAVLAFGVLLLFLRSFASTLVVATTIPISIIATFMAFDFLGRSLNTVSLAGISFAVGMLVDSAIVVLENIDRHKKMGKKFYNAAYEGTKEVWGALVASALTTIAVFGPIIFLENEAGQLFKDIAIAVTASVTFSLFVSISVIPMFWTLLMKFHKNDIYQAKDKKSLIVKIGNWLVDFIQNIVEFTIKTKFREISTIVILTVSAFFIATSLFPKMEYLPQGNRNLILNIFIPPPGISLEEKEEIGKSLFKKIEPYTKEDNKNGVPMIDRVFFVSVGDFMILGATTIHQDRPKELIPFFIPIINSFPGFFAISKQRGVFEQNIGKGRTVNLDISGDNLESLTNTSAMLFGSLRGALKDTQIRPIPSVELIFPEVKIKPDGQKLKAVGMDSTSLGLIIDVLMDGRKIGEYKEDGGKSIDIKLTTNNQKFNTPEEIYNSLITTPRGDVIPVNQISKVEQTAGITKIRHLNGKRTITLEISPPENVTLEETIDTLSNKILPDLRSKGMLKDVDISIAGTADKLFTTVKSLEINFILAIGITYLLLASLFSNFLYPLVILFTVPLAAAGGFLGLKLTNMFIAPQPMDILTMLGFIILIGIVVNNAILIVHQSLNHIRYDNMQHLEAVKLSVKGRLRPIYMSSLTSVFGMLPLVIAPGPGSELYRGLGSVITGGLALSTIFTIFLTPALLMFFIKMEKIGEKNEN